MLQGSGHLLDGKRASSELYRSNRDSWIRAVQVFHRPWEEVGIDEAMMMLGVTFFDSSETLKVVEVKVATFPAD